MKFHKFLKDGYLVPFNPQLEGNPLFTEVEVADGANPHEAKFLEVESDESAEAREAAALEAAYALVAKAKAKDAAAKQASK